MKTNKSLLFGIGVIIAIVLITTLFRPANASSMVSVPDGTTISESNK